MSEAKQKIGSFWSRHCVTILTHAAVFMAGAMAAVAWML